jgi:uncharacterized surface protein with fasciclin (FAS1) repeats
MRKQMTLARLPTAAIVAVLATFPFAASAQAPAAAPAAAVATPPPAAIPASPNVVPNGNLVSTLQGSGHFTILLKALDAAQLSATLKTAPNLTLFAPTDDAFQALPPSQLSQLLEPKNAPMLQKVLIYHVVNALVDSSKIKGAKGPVVTVEATPVVIDGSADVLKVNNADIIQADVKATNGLIHVIDKVLVPNDVSLPTASAAAATPTNG